MSLADIPLAILDESICLKNIQSPPANIPQKAKSPSESLKSNAAKCLFISGSSDSGKSSSGSPNLLNCSFDSGIAGVLRNGNDMQLHKRIQQCQCILLALERDEEYFSMIRNRLSKITKSKQKQSTENEFFCNVCCAEIDPSDEKTYVKCYICKKCICRNVKCSNWLPKTAEWECELCQTSKESLAQTSSWVADQITFNQEKLICPSRARSEIYIPISEYNDSVTHFESVSQVGANSSAITAEQKFKIREYVEQIVAKLLGGNLDTIAVNQLSKSENYTNLFHKYHSKLSNILINLENVLTSNDGGLRDSKIEKIHNGTSSTAVRSDTNDFSDISETRLRQMIQKIIAETVNLPPLTNGHATSEIALDGTSRTSDKISLQNNVYNQRHRTEHYFEPTIYQDLLATAVLNKIVDKQLNKNRNVPVRNNSGDCDVLDDNKKFTSSDLNFNIEKLSTSSGSSVEPRSDCSYPEEEQILNNNDEKSSDLLRNSDRDSVISDYLANHMIPLPDLSAMAESEDDDHTSVTSSAVADGTWEKNWLFKKKKSTLSSSVTASSVGMLVPDPKEDVRAQIGDKTADEVSDLSELGSDSDDSLNSLRSQLEPVNDRLINKHLIGGQNSKMILDELIERSSMISNCALPNAEDPLHIDVCNEHIITTDTKNEAINNNVNQQNGAAEHQAKDIKMVLCSTEPEDISSTSLKASDDNSESDGCTGFSAVEIIESTTRTPSVVEILAAMALGPMLAVPSADQPVTMTASDYNTFTELKELALEEIKARSSELIPHNLDVIPEESPEVANQTENVHFKNNYTSDLIDKNHEESDNYSPSPLLEELTESENETNLECSEIFSLLSEFHQQLPADQFVKIITENQELSARYEKVQDKKAEEITSEEVDTAIDKNREEEEEKEENRPSAIKMGCKQHSDTLFHSILDSAECSEHNQEEIISKENISDDINQHSFKTPTKEKFQIQKNTELQSEKGESNSKDLSSSVKLQCIFDGTIGEDDNKNSKIDDTALEEQTRRINEIMSQEQPFETQIKQSNSTKDAAYEETKDEENNMDKHSGKLNEIKDAETESELNIEQIEVVFNENSHSADIEKCNLDIHLKETGEAISKEEYYQTSNKTTEIVSSKQIEQIGDSETSAKIEENTLDKVMEWLNITNSEEQKFKMQMDQNEKFHCQPIHSTTSACDNHSKAEEESFSEYPGFMDKILLKDHNKTQFEMDSIDSLVSFNKTKVDELISTEQISESHKKDIKNFSEKHLNSTTEYVEHMSGLDETIFKEQSSEIQIKQIQINQTIDSSGDTDNKRTKDREYPGEIIEISCQENFYETQTELFEKVSSEYSGIANSTENAINKVDILCEYSRESDKIVSKQELSEIFNEQIEKISAKYFNVINNSENEQFQTEEKTLDEGSRGIGETQTEQIKHFQPEEEILNEQTQTLSEINVKEQISEIPTKPIDNEQSIIEEDHIDEHLTVASQMIAEVASFDTLTKQVETLLSEYLGSTNKASIELSNAEEDTSDEYSTPLSEEIFKETCSDINANNNYNEQVQKEESVLNKHLIGLNVWDISELKTDEIISKEQTCESQTEPIVLENSDNDQENEILLSKQTTEIMVHDISDSTQIKNNERSKELDESVDSKEEAEHSKNEDDNFDKKLTEDSRTISQEQAAETKNKQTEIVPNNEINSRELLLSSQIQQIIINNASIEQRKNEDESLDETCKTQSERIVITPGEQSTDIVVHNILDSTIIADNKELITDDNELNVRSRGIGEVFSKEEQLEIQTKPTVLKNACTKQFQNEEEVPKINSLGATDTICAENSYETENEQTEIVPNENSVESIFHDISDSTNTKLNEHLLAIQNEQILTNNAPIEQANCEEEASDEHLTERNQTIFKIEISEDQTEQIPIVLIEQATDVIVHNTPDSTVIADNAELKTDKNTINEESFITQCEQNVLNNAIMRGIGQTAEQTSETDNEKNVTETNEHPTETYYYYYFTHIGDNELLKELASNDAAKNQKEDEQLIGVSKNISKGQSSEIENNQTKIVSTNHSIEVIINDIFATDNELDRKNSSVIEQSKSQEEASENHLTEVNQINFKEKSSVTQSKQLDKVFNEESTDPNVYNISYSTINVDNENPETNNKEIIEIISNEETCETPTEPIALPNAINEQVKSEVDPIDKDSLGQSISTEEPCETENEQIEIVPSAQSIENKCETSDKYSLAVSQTIEQAPEIQNENIIINPEILSDNILESTHIRENESSEGPEQINSKEKQFKTEIEKATEHPKNKKDDLDNQSIEVCQHFYQEAASETQNEQIELLSKAQTIEVHTHNISDSPLTTNNELDEVNSTEQTPKTQNLATLTKSAAIEQPESQENTSNEHSTELNQITFEEKSTETQNEQFALVPNEPSPDVIVHNMSDSTTIADNDEPENNENKLTECPRGTLEIISKGETESEEEALNEHFTEHNQTIIKIEISEDQTEQFSIVLIEQSTDVIVHNIPDSTVIADNTELKTDKNTLNEESFITQSEQNVLNNAIMRGISQTAEQTSETDNEKNVTETNEHPTETYYYYYFTHIGDNERPKELASNDAAKNQKEDEQPIGVSKNISKGQSSEIENNQTKIVSTNHSIEVIINDIFATDNELDGKNSNVQPLKMQNQQILNNNAVIEQPKSQEEASDEHLTEVNQINFEDKSSLTQNKQCDIVFNEESTDPNVYNISYSTINADNKKPETKNEDIIEIIFNEETCETPTDPIALPNAFNDQVESEVDPIDKDSSGQSISTEEPCETENEKIEIVPSAQAIENKCETSDKYSLAVSQTIEQAPEIQNENIIINPEIISDNILESTLIRENECSEGPEQISSKEQQFKAETEKVTEHSKNKKDDLNNQSIEVCQNINQEPASETQNKQLVSKAQTIEVHTHNISESPLATNNEVDDVNSTEQTPKTQNLETLTKSAAIEQPKSQENASDKQSTELNQITFEEKSTETQNDQFALVPNEQSPDVIVHNILDSTTVADNEEPESNEKKLTERSRETFEVISKEETVETQIETIVEQFKNEEDFLTYDSLSVNQTISTLEIGQSETVSNVQFKEIADIISDSTNILSNEQSKELNYESSKDHLFETDIAHIAPNKSGTGKLEIKDEHSDEQSIGVSQITKDAIQAEHEKTEIAANEQSTEIIIDNVTDNECSEKSDKISLNEQYFETKTGKSFAGNKYADDLDKQSTEGSQINSQEHSSKTQNEQTNSVLSYQTDSTSTTDYKLDEKKSKKQPLSSQTQAIQPKIEQDTLDDCLMEISQSTLKEETSETQSETISVTSVEQLTDLIDHNVLESTIIADKKEPEGDENKLNEQGPSGTTSNEECFETQSELFVQKIVANEQVENAVDHLHKNVSDKKISEEELCEKENKQIEIVPSAQSLEFSYHDTSDSLNIARIENIVPYEIASKRPENKDETVDEHSEGVRITTFEEQINEQSTEVNVDSTQCSERPDEISFKEQHIRTQTKDDFINDHENYDSKIKTDNEEIEIALEEKSTLLVVANISDSTSISADEQLKRKEDSLDERSKIGEEILVEHSTTVDQTIAEEESFTIKIENVTNDHSTVENISDFTNNEVIEYTTELIEAAKQIENEKDILSEHSRITGEINCEPPSELVFNNDAAIEQSKNKEDDLEKHSTEVSQTISRNETSEQKSETLDPREQRTEPIVQNISEPSKIAANEPLKTEEHTLKSLNEDEVDIKTDKEIISKGQAEEIISYNNSPQYHKNKDVSTEISQPFSKEQSSEKQGEQIEIYSFADSKSIAINETPKSEGDILNEDKEHSKHEEQTLDKHLLGRNEMISTEPAFETQNEQIQNEQIAGEVIIHNSPDSMKIPDNEEFKTEQNTLNEHSRRLDEMSFNSELFDTQTQNKQIILNNTTFDKPAIGDSETILKEQLSEMQIDQNETVSNEQPEFTAISADGPENLRKALTESLRTPTESFFREQPCESYPVKTEQSDTIDNTSNDDLKSSLKIIGKEDRLETTHKQMEVEEKYLNVITENTLQVQFSIVQSEQVKKICNKNLVEVEDTSLEKSSKTQTPEIEILYDEQTDKTTNKQFKTKNNSWDEYSHKLDEKPVNEISTEIKHELNSNQTSDFSNSASNEEWKIDHTNNEPSDVTNKDTYAQSRTEENISHECSGELEYRVSKQHSSETVNDLNQDSTAADNNCCGRSKTEETNLSKVGETISEEQTSKSQADKIQIIFNKQRTELSVQNILDFTNSEADERPETKETVIEEQSKVLDEIISNQPTSEMIIEMFSNEHSLKIQETFAPNEYSSLHNENVFEKQASQSQPKQYKINSMARSSNSETDDHFQVKKQTSDKYSINLNEQNATISKENLSSSDKNASGDSEPGTHSKPAENMSEQQSCGVHLENISMSEKGKPSDEASKDIFQALHEQQQQYSELIKHDKCIFKNNEKNSKLELSDNGEKTNGTQEVISEISLSSELQINLITEDNIIEDPAENVLKDNDNLEISSDTVINKTVEESFKESISKSSSDKDLSKIIDITETTESLLPNQLLIEKSRNEILQVKNLHNQVFPTDQLETETNLNSASTGSNLDVLKDQDSSEDTPLLTRQTTVLKIENDENLTEDKENEATYSLQSAISSPPGNPNFSKKLQRQCRVVDTTPSFEDESPLSKPQTSTLQANPSNNLADLCQKFINDKHLLTALENRRRRTLLMHRFLSTLDLTHSADDRMEETDMVHSEILITENPLAYESLIHSCDHASDYDDCSDSSVLQINSLNKVSYNFINTILFSDQISNDSNPCYNSGTSTVEEYIENDNDQKGFLALNFNNKNNNKSITNTALTFNTNMSTETSSKSIINNATKQSVTNMSGCINPSNQRHPNNLIISAVQNKEFPSKNTRTRTRTRQFRGQLRKNDQNKVKSFKNQRDSDDIYINIDVDDHDHDYAVNKDEHNIVGVDDEHDDDDVVAIFRHFVPGSIAEREYKKWYNAVEMPNNPYAPEALKRRISGSQERFIDLPNISPTKDLNPLDLLNEPKLYADENKQLENDYKRYSRDYYINSSLISQQASPARDVSPPATKETRESTMKAPSTVERKTKSDLYKAIPAHVIEINLSPMEAMSTMSKEMQINLTSISDDSDTLKFYDPEKQHDTTTPVMKADTSLSKRRSETADELDGKERPCSLVIDRSENNVNAITPTRGSTPVAFKFLQPKRKLLEPNQILAVEEEGPETSSSPIEKPVIEAEVVKALPSVKALAKAFLLTSTTKQSEKLWLRKTKTLSQSGKKRPVSPKRSADQYMPLDLLKPEDDVTITSDLSSLETDSSSVGIEIATTSNLTMPTASSTNNPSSHMEAGNLSPVLVRQGVLKNNIAFFENLKNK